MKELWDLHSHIIPGVDDGSSSYEESLRMLKMASDQGVTHVLATSHDSPLFEKKGKEELMARFQRLKHYVKKNNIPVKLGIGQEIFYTSETRERLVNGELFSLAGTRLVLLEFLPQSSKEQIMRAVLEMRGAAYVPVIAHVERYRNVSDPSSILELKRRGALLQMNLGPVGEGWAAAHTRWCRTLLKNGSIDFVGSDMHNMDKRAPVLASALQWMEKHLDPLYVSQLCMENARNYLVTPREEEPKLQEAVNGE